MVFTKRFVTLRTKFLRNKTEKLLIWILPGNVVVKITTYCSFTMFVFLAKKGLNFYSSYPCNAEVLKLLRFG
jgi:hypothetical protein